MTGRVLIVTRDADAFLDRLERLRPGLDVVATTEIERALSVAAGCDVLMTRNDDRFEPLITAMPRLCWIQALTTGTDLLEACPALRPDVTITAARGFHGPQMSELAFLFMLALSRNFAGLLANQRERRWLRTPQRLIADKTVVVVGIGRIAEELARRCKIFGMRVLGVSAGRTEVAGFDAVHPRQHLGALASEADFLIVLVPASRETRHIVDAAVIAAMKPDAVLINLARGDVVDESALVDALHNRRIAGAGLDVFQTEPLPPDHPFWGLDNVLVTPHIGGMSDIYVDQVMPLVLENLDAYLAGTPDRMRYLVRR
jgi:D-2-hydroxyacid dehydrogenase (NADP+)